MSNLKTFVKLSGLTDPEGARAVPEGGAAGFVIDSPASPRSLSIARAAELVAEVPSGAEAWAIVANPETELIHRLFDEVGVDRVQVYGAVPANLEFLEIHHLVPSLAVPRMGAGGVAPAVPPAEDYSRLHLDEGVPALATGSAERVDWEICTQLVESNPGRKLVLAGGLTAESLPDALAFVRPWGVDLGVGVESAPGRIDPAKLEAAVKAIEAFDHPPA